MPREIRASQSVFRIKEVSLHAEHGMPKRENRYTGFYVNQQAAKGVITRLNKVGGKWHRSVEELTGIWKESNRP